MKTRVITQMGNQGSATDGLRRGVELALAGTIGLIREAHVWFDGGNGPLERPTDTPPVPATLDWDLPPVRLALWAREKPSADLLLWYPQQGWGDVLVGAKGSLHSECRWNTRFTLLSEVRYAEVQRVLGARDGGWREWSCLTSCARVVEVHAKTQPF